MFMEMNMNHRDGLRIGLLATLCEGPERPMVAPADGSSHIVPIFDVMSASSEQEQRCGRQCRAALQEGDSLSREAVRLAQSPDQIIVERRSQLQDRSHRSPRRCSARIFRRAQVGRAPGSMTMSTKDCPAQRASSSSPPDRLRPAEGKDGWCSLRAGQGRGEPSFRVVCSLREARGEEGRRNRLRLPPSPSRHRRPPIVRRVARRRPLGRLPLAHVADEDLAALDVDRAVVGEFLEFLRQSPHPARGDGSTPRTRFSSGKVYVPASIGLCLPSMVTCTIFGAVVNFSTPCLRRFASAWGEISSGSPRLKFSKTSNTSCPSRPRQVKQLIAGDVGLGPLVVLVVPP